MQLSPSKLSVFKECPRCFYFAERLGVPRPRGIFPSLPGGMDRKIKKQFDEYRRLDIAPPELKPLEGEGFHVELFKNQGALDKMRNWRSGLAWIDTDGSRLVGAIDDLLVCEAGLSSETGQSKTESKVYDEFILYYKKAYVPFDYKTKGSPANVEDATKYYQSQLDLYGLLLHENGYKPVADFGVLIFYSPETVQEAVRSPLSDVYVSVSFKTQVFKIPIDIERAWTTFRDAISLLNIAKLPSAGEDCEYCHYADMRQSFT